MTLDRVVAASASAALLLSAIALSRRATGRYLPAHLTLTTFAVVWAFSLGLYAIPWINYIQPSLQTWIVVYASIISFVGGALIGERLVNVTPRTDSTAPERLSTPRLHVVIILTAVITLMGFAFFVRALDATVGWRSLFSNLAAARAAQRNPKFIDAYGLWKTLVYAGGVCLLLWSVALRQRTFDGWRRLIAPIGLIVLVTYFFRGERLSLLTTVAWLGGFHLLWRPIAKPRVLVAVGVCAAIAGLGFFYLIGSEKGATISNHPEIRRELATHQFEEFSLPYVYVTANVPVFSQMSSDPIAPRTYGALTFLPAVKVANLVIDADDYPPAYGAFYEIPFDSYNSATWLGPFYRDFGIAGCIVMPALFGVAAAWIVGIAQRRRTLLTAWFGAITLTIIVFAPLKNVFSDTSIWELILLAPIIAWLVNGSSRLERVPSAAWRSLLSRPLLSAAALIVALGLGVTALMVRRTASHPAAQAIPAKRMNMTRAADALTQVFDRSRGGSPSALASQLRVSDPDVMFEPLATPTQTPESSGAIGVFAKDREFRLRAKTERGVMEVIGVARGGTYRVVGPRLVSRGLVRNPGFEDPLSGSWEVTSRIGVRVSRTTDALTGAYALRLDYVRKAENPSSAVIQMVRRLPRRRAGTRFTLRELVLPHGLNRQVVFGFQLLYRDGTSVYAAGQPRRPPTSRSEASGIPAGSSRHPLPLVAALTASKPVAGVRILAVDAGRKSISGEIVLDDVVLSVAKATSAK